MARIDDALGIVIGLGREIGHASNQFREAQRDTHDATKIVRHAGWSWRAHPEESLAHMSGFITELEEDDDGLEPPRADLPAV